MLNGPGTIANGLNRRENHERSEPELRRAIDFAAGAGLPNVICFSGNRRGMSDNEGFANCKIGLKRIVGYAEIASFPQVCVRADRRSAIKSQGLSVREALIQEWYNGREALIADGVAGAGRFKSGLRYGDFDKIR
jgi:hypothetical protein